MTTRARALARICSCLLFVVAGASRGLAGAPVELPVFCDDFEQADACDWLASPSCAAVCGISGSCDVDFCDCAPGTPFGYLEGHWAGTWEDTIYFVSGNVEATFSIVCGQVVASGIIDLSDLGLGSQAGTGIGTVDGSSLSFDFSADMVGGGAGTLTLGLPLSEGDSALGSSGTGSGSGNVTAPLSYGPFTFTGSVTSTTVSGTFDFTNPGGGEGNVSLTKD